MTKNQIIAKAMLTTLGVYAVFVILNARFYPVSDVFLLRHIISTVVCIVCLVLTAYYLIFKNDSLACRITGDQEGIEEDFNQRIYLIKAFRIAFVLLALLLLCSSSTVRVTFMMSKAFSLSNIRMWITDVIETKRITGNLSFSRYTGMYITGIIKLTVIAYLLSGATHIIRWHLKHSCLNSTEGLPNG